MAGIDRNTIVFDPAVGVTGTEDMTPDLLHKAVRNCLYVANMWVPCFNLPRAFSGPYRAGIIVPGARVQICCIYHSATTPTSAARFYRIHSDDASDYLEDVLADGRSYGEFSDPPMFNETPELAPVANPTRRVVLHFSYAVGNIPPFTAFYRLVGGN
jgi:hypothetical protein